MTEIAPTMLTRLRFTIARARRFARDKHGVSAVEFAILLPLMLTLFFGGVEVSQGVAADRKVTLVARTLGDLVAQSAGLTNADVTNIFNAGGAVLTPYTAANLKARFSSITINGDGTVATVAWSRHSNWQPRAGDVTALIPAALMIPNTSLIWAEATYSYQPAVGYVITGTLTLTDQIMMRPRLMSNIPAPV